MEPIRVGLHPICNTDNKKIRENIKKSRRYQSVKWAVANKNPCAVVGGGPGVLGRLHILKKWNGDIFAINDTAGFLSDNGIPCYLFSVDTTDVLFRIGPLVKGAVFATRVHREQMKQFTRSQVSTFHMNEDTPNSASGVEGGPTSVCRTAHSLLRMGYKGIVYFGCEGSFYDTSHVTGKATAASDNMMVIEAGGINYLTNAAFVLQCQHLVGIMTKHPHFLLNASDGLLKAMLEYPDTWEVVAIRDDLRKQYEAQGITAWTEDFDINENKMWRPDDASTS